MPLHATSLMTTSSGLKLGRGVNVRVGVLVGVFVGISVGVNVNVFVGVSVSVLVGKSVGVSVGVSVTVGVLPGVKVSVGVAVSGGVNVTVLAGVSVGVEVATMGSGMLDEFCGCDIVRETKSTLLLSVSSPLPKNSSAPPIAIVAEVEVGFALRSMLLLAEGFVAKALPSGSVPPPNATLSTSVTPASL